MASVFGTKHKRKTFTFNAAGIHDNTKKLFGITDEDANKYVQAVRVRGEVLTTGQTVVGAVAPNQIGRVFNFLPELQGNFDSIGDKDKVYIDAVKEWSLLTVDLHSMGEMIQSLQREIKIHDIKE